MSEVVVETVHLKKKYEDLIAVEDLNIHIDKGELVGFLGPNGAGKSTGISMLSTILTPTGGDAYIFGKSIITEKAEIRKKIGVIPQEIIIYDYLTARENCELIAAMHKIPKSIVRPRVEKLFHDLQLEEKIDTRSGKLSGGMKRRLNIIMGLVMDPEVIFIDEPSAGLDPKAAHITWDFIRSLRDQGKTILLTTHNMHEAEELCDRIYIIDEGKIVAEGSPEQLRANIGKGELFDLKFKEEIDLEAFKAQIYALGEYISNVQILSANRVVISAVGGIKRLMEIEKLLPRSLDSLENLNIHGNTLEDVFLFLTGKKLKGGKK